MPTLTQFGKTVNGKVISSNQWILVVALISLFFLSSCNRALQSGEDIGDCTIQIKSFQLSDQAFTPGATLSGEMEVLSSIPLDNVTLRSIVTLYLSLDDEIDDADIALSAFVKTQEEKGKLAFEQIHIPYEISRGGYNVIAHVMPQMCTTGDFTGEETREVSVGVIGL